MRSVVERLDRNELVEATAELNAEAAVVAVVLAVDPVEPDGVYTFGSFWMGSRYPLNQFQHAPAVGVPHGGTLAAGCVQ